VHANSEGRERERALVESLFWLASQCLGKGRDEYRRQGFEVEQYQLEAKLGRALGQLRHLYRIKAAKGMSKGQSEVSQV
jgi:hypothetical protein